MAVTTKFSGKQLVLLYAATVDTAPTIDLSGSSRSTEVQQQASEQDVSTRDDMMANASQFLGGPPQRNITHQGLDTTPANSRTWHNVDVNDTGRVAVYPLGSSPTGLPYEIGNVICLQSNYNSPHDNAATWNIQWRVNGPWTKGTT